MLWGYTVPEVAQEGTEAPGGCEHRAETLSAGGSESDFGPIVLVLGPQGAGRASGKVPVPRGEGEGGSLGRRGPQV